MSRSGRVALALAAATLLASCGLAPQVPMHKPSLRLAAKDVPLDLTSGLTPHFSAWLTAHGYGASDFERRGLVGGSFGGRSSDADPITRTPVIFIHGNSDKAIGTGQVGQSGWNASLTYFMGQGYTQAELYATTWGPADAQYSSQQDHSKAYLTRVRGFIQAVLAYTGAPKVSLITHSMGVTLTRKAIKGGTANDSSTGDAYDLGAPLTASVDTFVGIAGANHGLNSCVTNTNSPTCAESNGLYPGIALLGSSGLPSTLPSAFLRDLNATAHYEGAHVFSMWSMVDEVIGFGGTAAGKFTCQIPGQDGEKVFSVAPYGHFGLKDRTADEQYLMVTEHRAP